MSNWEINKKYYVKKKQHFYVDNKNKYSIPNSKISFIGNISSSSLGNFLSFVSTAGVIGFQKCRSDVNFTSLENIFRLPIGIQNIFASSVRKLK